MFSTLPKTNFNFSAKFDLSSANAFNLDQSKNLSFGKELTVHAIILDKSQSLQSGSDLAEELEKFITYLILSHMTNFRFFQTERVCRRQIQIL